MILIVDDDYDIASLVRISLEKVGHSAVSFTNPFSALEECKQKPFNYEVVISDIRMPDMNGYEFAKQVKMLNPNVNVILMTAFETEYKEIDSIMQFIKIDCYKDASAISARCVIYDILRHPFQVFLHSIG